MIYVQVISVSERLGQVTSGNFRLDGIISCKIRLCRVRLSMFGLVEVSLGYVMSCKVMTR
jgi:hypothetical protein